MLFQAVFLPGYLGDVLPPCARKRYEDAPGFHNGVPPSGLRQVHLSAFLVWQTEYDPEALTYRLQ